MLDPYSKFPFHFFKHIESIYLTYEVFGHLILLWVFSADSHSLWFSLRFLYSVLCVICILLLWIYICLGFIFGTSMAPGLRMCFFLSFKKVHSYILIFLSFSSHLVIWKVYDFLLTLFIAFISLNFIHSF